MLVPLTTDPKEPPTVARLASIPHGTTILAQGTPDTADGPPVIPDVSIRPFANNLDHPPTPADELNFPEPHLSEPSDRRTGGAGLHGITQKMVNNPNSVFLKGGGDGPNAVVTHVTATFWLETLQGDPEPRQLQYSQVVLLDFLDLRWPHATVATLHKKPPAAQSRRSISPQPAGVLSRERVTCQDAEASRT